MVLARAADPVRREARRRTARSARLNPDGSIHHLTRQPERYARLIGADRTRSRHRPAHPLPPFWAAEHPHLEAADTASVVSGIRQLVAMRPGTYRSPGRIGRSGASRRSEGIAMPQTSVHFNGSVNLPDAEAVMREISSRIP